MSPVLVSRLDHRELALLRAALTPVPASACSTDLGRAGVAAQLLWRERIGALAPPRLGERS